MIKNPTSVRYKPVVGSVDYRHCKWKSLFGNLRQLSEQVAQVDSLDVLHVALPRDIQAQGRLSVDSPHAD